MDGQARREQDDWRDRHAEAGIRLDQANAAVGAALVAGDDHEYALQLIERAWVAMLMRDLHGRTTVLGRTWAQFMVADLELSLRVAGGRHSAGSAGDAGPPCVPSAAPGRRSPSG